MKVLRKTRATRELLAGWRRRGEAVALVPTMGNLHDGHISLVDRARRHAARVVVTIFVNPTQFGPGEDFGSYPRTLAADQRRLRSAGVDAVWVPAVADVYPLGTEAATRVMVPGLSTILCGAHRPGHFDGVTSVVLRLLNVTQPELAVFGEKDYQQLTILRRMVADLQLPLRVVGAPIVREADGLAMSSRNQYLSAAERGRAPGLHAALADCRARLREGERNFAALERAGLAHLRRCGMQPDYFAIREARELGPVTRDTRRARVLAAVRLGRARLIDNLAVSLA